MRALIIIGGAALALSGCGGKNDNDTDQNFGDNLTAENIVSNDVTAIDAVTGDAANMAADVDLNFGNLGENVSDSVANAPAKTARPAPKKSPPPAAQPATNAATNAE